jgi:serine phosphatase RsbU (regulator of sigma subunit)
VEPDGRTARPSVAPERHRRTAQRTLFTAALVVLVAATVAGVLLARTGAVDTVEERAQQSADGAAALLGIEMRQVAAALSGSSAVVSPDGDLDAEIFAAFAGDPLVGIEDLALLLLDIVPADERAEFEARGTPLLAVEGDDLVPAGTADVHYPVIAVGTESSGRSILGVDYAADPVRREAVERAGAERVATVSGPLVLAVSGEPGVAVVRPVTDPDGSVVRGFIATTVPAARIESTVRTAVGEEAEVVVLDGEQALVGAEVRGVENLPAADLDVLGRTWRVAVRTPVEPDDRLSWLVAAAGLAAILTMATLLVLTERHQRRLARANALLARNERRSLAVQEVAGRLARALTGSEVASALVDHLPAAVGAHSAVVAIMERGGRFELLQAGSGPRQLPAPVVGSVVESALARHEGAWLQSPLGWRGDEVAAILAGEASALAVLPLFTDDVVGVLAVGYPSFHIFAEEEQALLQTVSVLAGRALSRGRRYDAEHQAAVAFQQAALPDELPTVAGLSVAARYRPATHGATVGGDWYDVLPLEDGRVLLVVGDVVGHGMVAAAAMGRLRTAFRTVVPYSADPGAMLQGISQQIDSIPDAFCTTVVSVVVDPERGTMLWSRAGHPPPLLVSDGSAELLDAPCLPPLGVDPDLVPRVHERPLAAGDLLVLYTDGVVERRDESLDDGFRRLGIVAESLADLEVEELADALLEAIIPLEDQTDDLALLVVRYEGPAVSG